MFDERDAAKNGAALDNCVGELYELSVVGPHGTVHARTRAVAHGSGSSSERTRTMAARSRQIRPTRQRVLAACALAASMLIGAGGTGSLHGGSQRADLNPQPIPPG